MARLSRTRKKPKGFGKKPVSEDPRDAQAKTGPGITERTAGLFMKRVGSSNGKTPYFRVEICASVLGAPQPDVYSAFATMVALGAIQKANGGAYAPTPKCHDLCVAYVTQQEAKRKATQQGGNYGRTRRRHHC